MMLGRDEMKFQVLKAASVKMAAFWDIAPVVSQMLTDVSKVGTASIIPPSP
jgi:hypothetical protein